MFSSLPAIDKTISDERNLGIAFRPAIKGPEDDLLETFLAKYHPRLNNGERCTLFRCPRLESSYPDAVFVVWNMEAATKALGRREVLTKPDLRLLHLLWSSGSHTDTALRDMFGSAARLSINRLEVCGIVRRHADGWECSSHSSSFVVREIIAIEAKMSNWSTALRQAELNTWFASRSWVLLPTMPSKSTLISDAGRLGIGILALDRMPHIPRLSSRFPLPRSYGSWLLNEWVLRALRREVR